jgi:hypothetical protein
MSSPRETFEHCSILGVITEVSEVSPEFRAELPTDSGRCFFLLESLAPTPLAPRSAWISWIAAANELGAQGWELFQVSDRQVWQAVPPWGIPAPPSTTYYPGKLLVMKRPTA